MDISGMDNESLELVVQFLRDDISNMDQDDPSRAPQARELQALDAVLADRQYAQRLVETGVAMVGEFEEPIAQEPLAVDVAEQVDTVLADRQYAEHLVGIDVAVAGQNEALALPEEPIAEGPLAVDCTEQVDAGVAEAGHSEALVSLEDVTAEDDQNVSAEEPAEPNAVDCTEQVDAGVAEAGHSEALVSLEDVTAEDDQNVSAEEPAEPNAVDLQKHQEGATDSEGAHPQEPNSKSFDQSKPLNTDTKEPYEACVSCNQAFRLSDLSQGPCHHRYCGICLSEMVAMSIKCEKSFPPKRCVSATVQDERVDALQPLRKAHGSYTGLQSHQ
ncbi:hypothetical protein D7B24_001827 [Verticillium nonalfalfae]|uniref:RING-type domain-containing protein n=1 Tax=Verticillium nonalfalfae TaxID=1051616 RepID=A0A3M9YKV6_9PEZI|nr:uncharacterized protein D7B24_001827 [Verticillium nonalfalfae]RNJ59650.1 hypothetical protein D7B24_001827 [Verticillium nonalfalfae]